MVRKFAAAGGDLGARGDKSFREEAEFVPAPCFALASTVWRHVNVVRANKGPALPSSAAPDRFWMFTS